MQNLSLLEEEESLLVDKVRRGDSSAYGELVRRHLQRAYSVAYRLLGNRHDAEDLVQDSFIVALEKIDQCKAGLPFAPWFFRLLVNQGLNARKRRSLRQTDILPESVPSILAGPEAELDLSEIRLHLESALDALSETERTVVQLFDLEGFSGKEVAEILSLPPGTIRWHLHKARGKLKLALAPMQLA